MIYDVAKPISHKIYKYIFNYILINIILDLAIILAKFWLCMY